MADNGRLCSLGGFPSHEIAATFSLRPTASSLGCGVPRPVTYSTPKNGHGSLVPYLLLNLDMCQKPEMAFPTSLEFSDWLAVALEPA